MRSTNHLIAMHPLCSTQRENRLQGGFRAYRMASILGVASMPGDAGDVGVDDTLPASPLTRRIVKLPWRRHLRLAQCGQWQRSGSAVAAQWQQSARKINAMPVAGCCMLQTLETRASRATKPDAGAWMRMHGWPRETREGDLNAPGRQRTRRKGPDFADAAAQAHSATAASRRRCSSTQAPPRNGEHERDASGCGSSASVVLNCSAALYTLAPETRYRRAHIARSPSWAPHQTLAVATPASRHQPAPSLPFLLLLLHAAHRPCRAPIDVRQTLSGHLTFRGPSHTKLGQALQKGTHRPAADLLNT
jgi:hypothetical protein